jgi:SAM-dependent methyltransferase
MKRSNIADKYLKGLKGVEIGGGAHNAFGLDTINVDYTDDLTQDYKQAELKNCGSIMPVDVVANGDDLPFVDGEWDFVINSHVIEHFYDPISTLNEWLRVIKPGGLLLMIIPHKERTFDKNRPLTTLEELKGRVGVVLENDDHGHHSVWNTETFLELCTYLGLNVVEYQDVDDKVGNGFTIVIKKGV